MNKKKCAIIKRFFILLVVMAFFGNFSSSIGQQSNYSSKIDINTIDKAVKENAKYSMIPPIDMAAPSIYETASFGLG